MSASGRVAAARAPRWLAAAGAAILFAAPSAAPAEDAGVPPAEESVPPARAVPPGATLGGTTRMCGVCHSDVRVKFDKGVHRAEGIGCVPCHGGDPNATTVEGAHRGNFRGVPSRRAIPALCASCHADVARMRPYNLPSDQYALYQTSQHGILLAKGDRNVAVCTDCHGVHEIRPRDDPESRVFARNIPATCGRCHGNAALLRKYGRRDNPLLDYSAGVHGVAFLKEGNDAAPECTRCHGSHGAAPPGVGDVEKVCGQCHSKARSYFLAGRHKEAMDAAGEPECAACHRNHRTPAATPAMLDTVCRTCHEDPASGARRVAARFQQMLTGATVEIERADRSVADAARIPLYVEDYKARLQDARTALLEAYPVMHALDTLQMEPHARRARSIAEQVADEIHEKVAGRVWNTVGLGLLWFYLLVTAVILTRARRRAAAERDR
ncbi:MAG TPA: cytochrome c3 family protein [Candidatus Eisenbacteria bacterium]|jgi:predicted CXXCH cytochrome family protein